MNLLAEVLEKGLRGGYGSIVMSDPLTTKDMDVVSKATKTFKQGILGVRTIDQVTLTIQNKPVKEGPLEAQNHYYVADSRARLIKVLMS